MTKHSLPTTCPLCGGSDLESFQPEGRAFTRIDCIECDAHAVTDRMGWIEWVSAETERRVA